jgi:hypothetical protein
MNELKSVQIYDSQAIADALNTFDGEGNTLANADTHRGERAAATCFLQLVHSGEDEAGAAHAERVAQRNGSAVGIHMRGVVR